MKVKICGITNVEDALYAEKAGADAIGLVFQENSKRFVDFAKAADICKALGVFIVKVGVFVDANPKYVLEVAKKLHLSAIQLHGKESEDYILRIKRYLPVIKATNINDVFDIKALKYTSADALLIDSSVPGSGKTFKWSKAKSLQKIPKLILAGGLTPQNVSEGIGLFKPYAVDVSSGVELSYGIKDHQKMLDFILIAKKASYPQACG